MKAEWNDAPDHIRGCSRKGAVAWLIPGLIGIAITLAVLQMASSGFLKRTAQSIDDKHIPPKPAPVAEITRAEPLATRDWDRVVEEAAARGATAPALSGQSESNQAEPAPKQTVFNDRNYVPQGATNIVPAIRANPEFTLTMPPRPKEIVVVGKESRISDFCPGAEGSIERRNCKASVNLSTRN